MSGIIGSFNLDRAPIDRSLLGRLTASMAFRGPDGQHTWSEGCIGLGHTLLQTDGELLSKAQPCTLDGQVWVAADARLDGRPDLIRALAAYGRTDLDRANDAELILHAYLVWDSGCLGRLIGDFVFALWDARVGRLLCARDQLGIKPFFYLLIGRSLVFGNTLRCLRRFPGSPSDLDENAIADFLLFDVSQDPAATAFRGIKRLPPAHYLDCSIRDANLHVVRYWSMPSSGCIRYRKPAEYIEQFSELLSTAVADRVRGPHAGIFLSGGLDSASVAALAANRTELRAYTAVVDHLYPDDERYFSGLVAQALRIPVRFQSVDNVAIYEGWGEVALPFPEPTHMPLAKIFVDDIARASSHSRVILTGHGGDQVLTPSATYFPNLLRRFRLRRLLSDGIQYARNFGSIPGLGIRSSLRRCLGCTHCAPTFPGWLDESFVKRLALHARWETYWQPPPPLHETRPEAVYYTGSPDLRALVETFDPGNTLVPAELRHPYCDVRLLAFLLAIPPVPWFPRKLIVRKAMAGQLPRQILTRPKTPVAGDPIGARIARSHAETERMNEFESAPSLANFVRRAAVPRFCPGQDQADVWINTRPLSLNYWLARDTQRPYLA